MKKEKNDFLVFNGFERKGENKVCLEKEIWCRNRVDFKENCNQVKIKSI